MLASWETVRVFARSALECADSSALCGGSGLVSAAGVCAPHPWNTPPAAASCLLPQSADIRAERESLPQAARRAAPAGAGNSAHSKAGGETGWMSDPMAGVIGFISGVWGLGARGFSRVLWRKRTT